MGRLAFFLPSFNGGGAERVMVTLANAFAARGYLIDLVVSRAEGPYLKDISPLVKIIDLGAGRMIRSFIPLVHYLRRERPVAVLSAMNYANVLVILARFFSRVPTRLVISEHTTISVAARNPGSFFSWLVYKTIPIFYRFSDAIVTVSKAASDDLVKFARLPNFLVKTIYNPFDIFNIQSGASETLNHSWFRPGGAPVVVAAGRLVPEKDFSTLIKAFAILRERLLVRLIILGSGELKEELDELKTRCGLSDDDVRFEGFIKNPYPYLKKCDLFVLSSIREGLPTVLIEALACGTQVLSTDCPSGPREILEGGRWGRLVPMGNEVVLAEAMFDALSSPIEGRPNVQQRAADFAQEKAVDLYLKVLIG